MTAAGSAGRRDLTVALPSGAARQGGIQKLPMELLYHIVRLAASANYKTAQACAYVSKTLCKWTAPDRWKTIICTSAKQFESLWYLLESDGGRYGSPDFISLPSNRPGPFVENLFIDTKCPRFESSDILHNRSGNLNEDNVITRFLARFTSLRYLAMGPVEVSAIKSPPATLPSKVLITSDNEDELRCCLAHFAEDSKLGSAPYQLNNDGVWVPSWHDKKRLRSLHVISMNQHSELTGAPMPVGELEVLCTGSIAAKSLIRRIALGVPGSTHHLLPPAEQEKQENHWKPLEEESPAVGNMTLDDNTHSRVPKTDHLHSALQAESGQGCLHIRYDTRKFSLRPCEITASRLRPFFQELTTIAESNEDSRSQVADFSHSGPRHAAPPRGAGNFSVPGRSDQSHTSHMTAKRAILGLFGCNKFRKLHLCWDPVPASNDSPTFAHGNASLGDSSKANGKATVSGTDWPLERHDIWTNTSSQRDEAQAAVPHAAKSRSSSTVWSQAAQSSKTQRQSAEAIETGKEPLQTWVIPSAKESKQSKAFRADMVDAFRTTIGWTQRDQEMLSDTNWLSRYTDLAHQLGSEEALNSLEDFFSQYHNNLANRSTNYPSSPGYIPPPAASDEKLALRLVAPAERLRLGGLYVPYTKEQRVKWFLDNLETDDA